MNTTHLSALQTHMAVRTERPVALSTEVDQVSQPRVPGHARSLRMMHDCVLVATSHHLYTFSNLDRRRRHFRTETLDCHNAQRLLSASLQVC